MPVRPKALIDEEKKGFSKELLLVCEDIKKPRVYYPGAFFDLLILSFLRFFSLRVRI